MENPPMARPSLTEENWERYMNSVRITDADKARLDAGEMLEVEIIQMQSDGMPVLPIKTAATD